MSTTHLRQTRNEVNILNKTRILSAVSIFLCLAYLSPTSLAGQTTSTDKTPTDAPQICSFHHLGRCAKDIAGDHVGIWTSPFKARSRDLLWIVPFGAAVGTSLAYDTDALAAVGTSQSRIDFGKHVSTAGSPYTYIGTSGLLYITGVATKNFRIQETGRLGGEAVVDALLLNEGLKLATQRDRPSQGNGNGNFWPHGTKNYNFDSSMPSAHATVAWAFARVVSSQYPDKLWLKVFVYGAATTISVARVLARDHFPSDVVVGSTFGYLTGTYVVLHRSEQYAAFAATPFFDAHSHAAGLTVSFPPRIDPHVFRALPSRMAHLITRRNPFGNMHSLKVAPTD